MSASPNEIRAAKDVIASLGTCLKDITHAYLWKTNVEASSIEIQRDFEKGCLEGRKGNPTGPKCAETAWSIRSPELGLDAPRWYADLGFGRLATEQTLKRLRSHPCTAGSTSGQDQGEHSRR